MHSSAAPHFRRAVKFLRFFNRLTLLPLIFAEPGFDPEITLDLEGNAPMSGNRLYLKPCYGECHSPKTQPHSNKTQKGSVRPKPQI